MAWRMTERAALITGISGQDGSYMAELLVSQGYSVAGIVRPGRGSAAPNLAAVADKISLYEADLADFAALRQVVAQVAPDELYHLGAPTFVPDSWEDPESFRAQIGGATEALLDAARGTPARVLVATSSEIFGDAGVSPQDEDSPKRPRTPYGRAKLAAHEAVQRARADGVFAVSAITYNHESPRRPERFLPRKVTRGAAAIALGLEEELAIGDLDAVRDWSHALDIVRGEWLALQADEPRDYVFASGGGRRVRELVDCAFAAAGVSADGRVRVDPAFVRPPEQWPPVGDPSRARAALGWEPEIGFEAMIAEMVEADRAALSATADPGPPESSGG